MDYEEPIASYLKIAEIYSKERLSPEHHLAKAEEYDSWKDPVDRLISYLRNELSVPTDHKDAILKLGRRLSELELKALGLKKEIEKSKVTGITVSIEGLE